MMLWFSGVLIAACIGASALNNIVIRVILGLVGLWLLIAGTGINNFAMGRGDFWEIVVWLAIFGFFIPALLFELAASSFAPVSENHAVRRRILVLLFMAAVASVISLMRDNAQAQVGISLIVLIAICYVELSEKARLLPRFVRPMSRRNWLGKLLWLFFLPGWPSGVLFALVVIPSAFLIQLLMITPFFDASSSVFLKSLLLIFAIFGSALVPILICHLFWRKMNQVFLMIALYNLLIVCVASILKGFASLTNTPVDQVLVVVPSLPVFFINLQDSHDDLLLNYILGNVVVLAVLLSIVYISSRRYFRELFALARVGKNLEPSSVKAEAEALKPVA